MLGERLGQAQLVEEVRQCLRLGAGGLRVARAAVQPQQRRGGAAAQGVYLLEGLIGVLPLPAAPLRRHPPLPGGEPVARAYAPGAAVVLQLIRLLRRQPREAGAQVGEHLLLLPAAQYHLIGPGYQRGQRLGEHVHVPGREERHAVVAEGRLQGGPVVLKAAHGYGYVPPAAARPGQAQALGRGELALGRHALRRAQLHPPSGVARLPGVGEHPRGQLGERVPLRRGQLLQLPGHAALLRRAQQPPGRAPAELKQLVVRVERVQRQADGHVRPPVHQRADHELLLAGEVGEAVYVYVPAAGHGAALQRLQQLAQPGGGVAARAAGGGVKGPAEQREVAQLVGQGPPGPAGGLLQQLRRERGGAQLVQGVQQLQLQLRRAPRPAVGPQAAGRALHGQGHAEQPPGGVQRSPAARPQLGLHPPGQGGEAQHLGVEGHARRRHAGELALGLVAVLLRHQQYAPALAALHGQAYLLHYLRGLAGARAAGDYPQHSLSPTPLCPQLSSSAGTSSGLTCGKGLTGRGSPPAVPISFSIHTMSYQRPNLYPQPRNSPTSL